MSTRMTGLFDTENPLNPGDNLMRRRISRLVEVHDTVLDVLGERSFQRRVAGRKRSVVAGTNVELVVVFEENRPLRSVN